MANFVFACPIMSFRSFFLITFPVPLSFLLIFGAPILSFITFLCFSSTFPKTNHLNGISSFLLPAHNYGSGWKLINISSHRCLGESSACCSLGFVPHYSTKERESGRSSSCSNPPYTESVNPTVSHLSPLSSKAKSLSSTWHTPRFATLNIPVMTIHKIWHFQLLYPLLLTLSSPFPEFHFIN